MMMMMMMMMMMIMMIMMIMMDLALQMCGAASVEERGQVH